MASVPGVPVGAGEISVPESSSSASLSIKAEATDLSGLWPVGVCVILVGSFAGAVGDILIRRSFLRMGGCLRLGSVVKNPGWVWGMLLTAVLDPISTFVALLFAPATIVAPFAGMHIFWGCLLAVVYLKERMRPCDVAGAALIILGITLIVIFSGKDQVISSVPDFAHYLPLPGAIAYMCIFSSVSLVASLLSADSAIARLFPPARYPGLGVSVQRMALSCASGIVGGATNIGAKALVIALTGFFAHPKETLSSWSTYLIVFLAAFLGLFQLYYLNMALRKYEASYVVPMINSFLIASGSVGGILILQEHPDNWAAFFCGLALVVCGVFVLSGSKATSGGGSAGPSGPSGPRLQASIAAGELVRLASFISFGDGSAGDAYESKDSRRLPVHLESGERRGFSGDQRSVSLRESADPGKTRSRNDRGEAGAGKPGHSGIECSREETPRRTQFAERTLEEVETRRGRAASPDRGIAGARHRDEEEDLESAAFGADDEEASVPAALRRDQPLVQGAAVASSSEEEDGIEANTAASAKTSGRKKGDARIDSDGLLVPTTRCGSPLRQCNHGDVSPTSLRILRGATRECCAGAQQGCGDGTAPNEASRQPAERRCREKPAPGGVATSPLLSSRSRHSKCLKQSDAAEAPSSTAAATWGCPARGRKDRVQDEVGRDRGPEDRQQVETGRPSSSTKDLAGRGSVSGERLPAFALDRFRRHNTTETEGCHGRKAPPSNPGGVYTDFDGDWRAETASRECYGGFRGTQSHAGGGGRRLRSASRNAENHYGVESVSSLTRGNSGRYTPRGGVAPR
ncbi:hypothetical protein NCLIV_041230 [Neospora caninum Liverpool]|uniref:Magnesium transporter NIPA3 n=1 Tax=Neospora caninum (strain Liverpool) TaxID=572307 RepID=F0VBR4_NEOCL|nr:hypothetical protein NCLIV_041230 [Neospora caninum Liverpool]CBZ51048.1 hypothetical protein NCLIV_041230 [Neospora caninum Liverpool]CEL68354.1 TPA: Magnesium transporter NIPA3 [Neospora caninum Liverpool]|eukprot:XP_003881081.1 hypothetical protein NCLIV_041230 [Neospora caninum Liverpool]